MRSILPSALLTSVLAVSNVATAKPHWGSRLSNVARGWKGNHHLSVGGKGDGSEVDLVASAWYAGWHADNFTLDDVSWDKYTQLTYAFG